jgi:group I intron endonuclease
MSGIYKIVNLINGMIYIGSSYNINKRIMQHVTTLVGNRHPNHYLQNAWNKYGQSNFEFIIIEFCLIEELLIREQYWLDNFKCYDAKIGYNHYPTAGSPKGHSPSIETRQKLSDALKNKPKSEEHRRKYSEWQTGRILTDGHKKNISLGRIGNQFRRKKDKWPHDKGNKCDCLECSNKRAAIKKAWDQNQKHRIKEFSLGKNQVFI